MHDTTAFTSEQLNFILQNEIEEPTWPENLNEESLRDIVLKSLQMALEQFENDFETAEITLRVVDSAEAQQLNHQYRQKDYATNVLTFEYGTDATATLRADIVICAPVVQREATEQDKSLEAHFKHLLVHGTLHALGFDHQNDDEAADMESLEIEILAQFQIKNPYL